MCVMPDSTARATVPESSQPEFPHGLLDQRPRSEPIPAAAWLFSADLLRPLQLLDQLRDRNRRQGRDLHRATRAEVDREMRDGRIVGGLDDGDEIMRAQ